MSMKSLRLFCFRAYDEDECKKCYKQLLDAGLLQQFQDDIEGIRAAPNSTHFICPQGSGSLVKYFVNKADCDILFQHRVIELNTVNNKWMALCENGSNFEFDAVILTLPVPQVLQLKGITSQLSDDHLNKLKAVEYCSRFALGCFFEKDYEFFKNSSWSGKFLSDNIIRFCSIDHCKRGSSGLPSVAIHTTKEFGKLHIDDSNLSTIQDTVIQRLKELFPEMPLPSQIKFHKWRYSQAEKSCQVQGSLKLAENPYLICGGDGFTYSTFEGCILSAESIADNLAKKSYL
ncbi:hypothetical protein JTE90_000654 [Oedothorax gibbosus]|uniref:Amine oxidase domain-containing protein n=1 Tax=Oedothorax gibbosus TaxID=931172 RepID=A0AAV6VV96_9ARAC|nr:hypothetical protein JTE90_000654 [Oedothorax gibbosus]